MTGGSWTFDTREAGDVSEVEIGELANAGLLSSQWEDGVVTSLGAVISGLLGIATGKKVLSVLISLSNSVSKDISSSNLELKVCGRID